MGTVLDTLRARGFVEQVTKEDELQAFLAKGPTTAYVGFDPTAKSLHCGSLMLIMALAHIQEAGHKVLPLIGGGTGLIGDPSGKTELRKMLTAEKIQENMAGQREQIGRYLKLEDGSQMVNNADWLGSLNVIEFLRDIGRQFSVNRMLAAKTYKDRFDSENGLNFIEFNYQIFQAFDFLHLYQNFDCHLQLGGNDQWGNMCAGVDLIRRVTGKDDAFCITWPLLTTSDGRKMGKTADGAVWLDAEQTSPHDFFQFWRDCSDADVKRFLKYFTFLGLEEIDELTKESGRALNAAKLRLAYETTKLCHGEDEARKARDAATGSVEAMPTIEVERKDFDGEGVGLLNVFSSVAGMATSNGQVRGALKGGGIYLNEEKMSDPRYMVTLSDFNGDGDCFLRWGKKRKMRLKLK